MSILSKAIGLIESAASIPDRALKLAEKVLHAVEAVWAFLSRVGSILTDAWNWVVNGAAWFADQVGGWAGEVFRTLWQTITHTIPAAIAWVFNQAVKWAAHAIRAVYNELKGWVKGIYHFLVKLIHDLVRAVEHALSKFVHWAVGPIKWVLKWGAWLIHLITNPGRLASYLAGAIVFPVVKWFLKAGADVVVWLLRRSIAKDSALVHLFEDVLAKLL